MYLNLVRTDWQTWNIYGRTTLDCGSNLDRSTPKSYLVCRYADFVHIDTRGYSWQTLRNSTFHLVQSPALHRYLAVQELSLLLWCTSWIYLSPVRNKSRKHCEMSKAILQATLPSTSFGDYRTKMRLIEEFGIRRNAEEENDLRN